MNFGGVSPTLQGGGTFNFITFVGYNSGGAIQDTVGGTVNLEYAVDPAQSGNSVASVDSSGYVLEAGTLNFKTQASANAFYWINGGNHFTITGGAIDNTSGAPMTLTVGGGGIQIGGSFTFNGSNPLNFGAAAVALSNNPTITVNAGTLTIGGPISGANQSLALAGAGTLLLSGNNTLQRRHDDQRRHAPGRRSQRPARRRRVTLGGAGTSGVFDLGGFNQQVSGLAVAAGATPANQTITNNGSSDATLTFNGSGAGFDIRRRDPKRPRE